MGLVYMGLVCLEFPLDRDQKVAVGEFGLSLLVMLVTFLQTMKQVESHHGNGDCPLRGSATETTDVLGVLVPRSFINGNGDT